MFHRPEILLGPASIEVKMNAKNNLYMDEMYLLCEFEEVIF
jgi:hypothetical protein